MKIKPQRHLLAEITRLSPGISGLLVISFINAMLAVAPILYVNQLFTRISVSRSVASLISLTIIFVAMMIVLTLLERLRSLILQRMAFAIDERIAPRVFDCINRRADLMSPAMRHQALGDLNTLRDFFGSPLLASILDAMFIPIIFVAIFALQPLMGAAVLVMCAIVVVLAVLNQTLAKDPIRYSNVAASSAYDFGRVILQTSETARTQGMLPALIARWRQHQRSMIGWQHAAADRVEIVSGLARFMRNANYGIIMAIGFALYIGEYVSVASVLTISIIVNRVVGPIDGIANSWRPIWNAVLAAERVDHILREDARKTEKIDLPRPDGPLVVSRLAVLAPNREASLLADVSFSVGPGSVVAVVGPSGAGKSTLARALIGAWPAARGAITLDGHDLTHWDQDKLGKYLGYVPQDVDLLPGTLAENIARFAPPDEISSAAVLAAVQLAGIQDIVGKLEDGLNTKIGPEGVMLSAGQRQRVALARAVYGDPRFLVLDEPNSNLDAMGEQRLAATIGQLRDRGAIVILVTHRLNMIAHSDFVLVLNGGTVQAFGPREQVSDRLIAYRPKEGGEREGPPPRALAAS